MSAVAFLDDNTYIGAEDNFNIFVASRNPDGATDEVSCLDADVSAVPVVTSIVPSCCRSEDDWTL